MRYDPKALIVSGSLALFIAGCSGDSTTGPSSSAPVAVVELSAGPGSLYSGRSVTLTATTKDAQGQTLSGRVVTWTTSNPAAMSVSATGLVAAVAFGSSTITATSEGVSASVTIGVLHDPIVFVHGFSSSGAAWGTMINRFKADGWAGEAMSAWSYDSGLSNVAIAQLLKAEVGRIIALTGATRVDVVSHSMGSLSSRYFAKNLGGDGEIEAFVSLAGPNHGTTVANGCQLVACVEMQPGSTFLNALNAGDETPGSPRYATWRSPCDQAVDPPESVILAGATNNVTGCLAHTELNSDQTVYQQVRDWIR